MELKDRINEAMTAAKLSPADLARATKSTNAAINFWLTGKTKSLKAEKAAMIETATGYCAQWVISGKGKKLLADEKIEQNHTVAPVVHAQAAINNVATLEQAIDSLIAHLAQVDATTRAAAGGLLLALAQQPDNPAIQASLTALLRPAAFIQAEQKAA